MPGEIRVCATRVAVQRHVLHIVAIIENFLGAIAVVVVDIEHRDLAAGASNNLVRSDRGIVEKAVTAIQITRGMVPRRATQTIGSTLAPKHHIGCSKSRVNRSAGRSVGAFGEWCGGFKTPPTQPGNNRIGLFAIAHLITQLVTIKHVGHHFAPCAHHLLILGPCFRQKLHETCVVHCRNRLYPMIARGTKRKLRVSQQCRLDGFGAARVFEG